MCFVRRDVNNRICLLSRARRMMTERASLDDSSCFDSCSLEAMALIDSYTW